jgi:excinuclease UvrABC nuclease subunit
MALVEPLPNSVAIAPDSLEPTLAQVPARWAVYLMADEQDRPVQLLCVKNLRASVRRRLGEAQLDTPTRKVDYRLVVRRIHWQRVDSALEADLLYLDAARAIFPESYRGMLGLEPAWFIHVNPQATFPRLIKTSDPRPRAGVLLGPIRDKHAAARLIELTEDVFDLCRYYSILVQAPRGSACAYKQMGKCPAPCDGSVSMDHYRHMVAAAVRALIDPTSLQEQTRRQMEQAAAELRFESAAKFKGILEKLGQFRSGPWKHLRPLEDFRFLAVQPAGAAHRAKVLAIDGGTIRHLATMIAVPGNGLAAQLAESARSWPSGEWDMAAVERLAMVNQHLLYPKQGALIPLAELSDAAMAVAWQQARSAVATETDEEGVLRQLQSVGSEL